MPNSSAKRSADPWLRDPTATATPESVSRRSVTNVLAIPPVPRIPHRTGLSATSSSLRRPVPAISLFEGRGPRLGLPALLDGELDGPSIPSVTAGRTGQQLGYGQRP